MPYVHISRHGAVICQPDNSELIFLRLCANAFRMFLMHTKSDLAPGPIMPRAKASRILESKVKRRGLFHKELSSFLFAHWNELP